MPTITPASEASNAKSSGPLPVTQETALNSLESDVNYTITLSDSTPGMCDEGISDLSKVSVPPRVSKRGRPKGRDLTVIGLPAKKQCPTKKKLLPFIKLHPSIKEQRLLKMFVDESVMKRVTHSGSLIEEEEVEVRPEHVSIAVLDENVNHYIIRKYFTSDAQVKLNYM